MGKLDGKTALITGVARGQGRAHALRLAAEGARIVGVDIPANDGGLDYSLADDADVAATVSAIEDLGGDALIREGDVRDRAQLDAAVAAGVERFGGIDIVIANAGIGPAGKPSWEIDKEDWDRVIAVNLTGVWQTVAAAAPAMIDRGAGGSVVVTTSTAGMRGFGYIAAYVAAKHGAEGLVRTFANELGPHSIRVNSIAPTVVNTPLFANDMMYRSMRPDLEAPGLEDVTEATAKMHLLPIPYIEAEDIANAAAWLVSDEARYVTGTTVLIDGGQMAKAG